MRPKCKRLSPGHYIVVNSEDGDNRPYELRLEGRQQVWRVYDSRGRQVSWHGTKKDAAWSLPLAGDTWPEEEE